jgi:predicted RNase H-like nuclease
MSRFLGVDLGWYGKPTGLALMKGTQLLEVTRLERTEEILAWIDDRAGRGAAVAAVDAPLVIPNATGIRDCERELNADFRRYHAGCHASNLGLPFAQRVTGFAKAMESLGFRHGASMRARASGRHQIEVHPHAATVTMFGLERIIKYKRGLRAERAGELRRLRALVGELVHGELPAIPRSGPLKPAEDQIDATLCAYIAKHWWERGRAGSRVYGTNRDGYIVVPAFPDDALVRTGLGRG